MPRHVFWKGHLRLSLVTAAVSLTPATTESGKVRFHVLNRNTGNRVESVYADSTTHRRVADKNQVKGFAKEDGSFVLLEDDEIDEVGLESTRTIDVQTFVPKDSIDWIWYDRPHFLKPEDKIGAEAFGVIREAMKANDVAGIARLVLYRREHAVLLEPAGKGIILWTLRYADEVREGIDTLEPKKKMDTELLSMMEKRIEKNTTAWKPAIVQDTVQKKIKSLLKSKEKDKAPAPRKSEATKKTGGNVINIMDALKKSLASEKRG
ncbi:putative Ku protein [Agrobacterium rubi TR3 = NBRC 13261]|uniref:Non-homologous end joining protein Ku n=1 Tax=Agrobacterium rubi TR3 = NBRC 13261 TaxID=1368415 RepID=A0A081CQE1_9HYPH|nr:Ku protein [Agrobacterium rubi]MBP1877310.1 DNA end-binding protein Ku [Agrobacterium rubi]MCL6651492.1 Ku protein [Agrobacterium rubi]GAK68887.1 putative Ku protein [Agrobacterium rubi TR3 = NBRC 13261]